MSAVPNESQPLPDQPESGSDSDHHVPTGSHALEVAARSGIGPLSDLGKEVWHGYARPCVSCGQLVDRDAPECDHCAQDLSEEMLRKMLAHAGPWYVLEHVRPFPGVTLERIIRQIRRGVLDETSIIRGPETNHRWRFAVETPGLCRFFGKCWRCHGTITRTDDRCRGCGAPLGFGGRPGARADAMDQTAPAGASTSDSSPTVSRPQPIVSESSATLSVPAQGNQRSPSRSTEEPSTSAEPEQAEELKELSAAVRDAKSPARGAAPDGAPKIVGISATWIIIAMIVAMIAVLLLISDCRSETISGSQGRVETIAPIRAPLA